MEEPNDDITEITVLEELVFKFDKVSKQVDVLNKNVYTKNHLDKIRNFLILGFIVTFLVVSGFLGLLLINQKSDDAKRSEEAKEGRRQIADCTVKPGVVLDDGYINPGECYTESGKRTAELIESLTFDIQDGVRKLLLIQAEAVAANETLSEDVRDFARQQAQVLKAFVPKTTSSTIP